MAKLKLSTKKKMKNTMFIAFFLIICLITRIGYISIVQGKELSKMAYEQQTLDREINTKRGTIYDRTGKNTVLQLWILYIGINIFCIDKTSLEAGDQPGMEIKTNI